MNLPNDKARCHDTTCQLRDKCVRFLERNTGAENTPHWHSMNDGEETCSHLINNEAYNNPTVTVISVDNSNIHNVNGH